MAEDGDLDDILQSALDDFEVPAEKSEVEPASAAGGPDAPQETDENGEPELNDKLLDDIMQALQGLDASGDGKGSEDLGDDEALQKFARNLEEQVQKLGDTGSVLDELFSADNLRGPMLELRDKYDEFLGAENSDVSADDLERYRKQRECVDELCKLYEQGTSDSGKVMEILETMQSYGAAPESVVQDIGGEEEPDPAMEGLQPSEQDLKAMQESLEQCKVQ